MLKGTRMTDYESLPDGREKILIPLLLYVYGIRGRRVHPVRWDRISRWFTVTSHDFITNVVFDAWYSRGYLEGTPEHPGSEDPDFLVLPQYLRLTEAGIAFLKNNGSEIG